MWVALALVYLATKSPTQSQVLIAMILCWFFGRWCSHDSMVCDVIRITSPWKQESQTVSKEVVGLEKLDSYRLCSRLSLSSWFSRLFMDLTSDDGVCECHAPRFWICSWGLASCLWRTQGARWCLLSLLQLERAGCSADIHRLSKLISIESGGTAHFITPNDIYVASESWLTDDDTLEAVLSGYQIPAKMQGPRYLYSCQSLWVGNLWLADWGHILEVSASAHPRTKAPWTLSWTLALLWTLFCVSFLAEDNKCLNALV